MPAPDLQSRLACRERPGGWPVLFMRWERLLFLHWAWDPGTIQKTLPEGLRVDTHEGQAWLGVVPFFMRRVHPTGLPCAPWLSDFLELNVRTYVYDAQGRPGVWFYSLTCNQPVAVELARRFFHLNYVHGRMEAQIAAGAVSYRSRRGGGPQAEFHYQADGPTRAAAPHSLEFFLIERYHLFSAARNGRIYSGRVHHAPYQTAPAAVKTWSFVPAEADGFEFPGRGPDHALVADDLSVTAWPIRGVSRTKIVPIGKPGPGCSASCVAAATASRPG